MLNKRTQLKIRKISKIRKRDLKEKTRQETKKEKGLMKKNILIEYFDVVLLIKQKQRRKKGKEKKQQNKQ